MMKKVGVAILGLGVVGGGTYKILTEHREFYQRTQNVDIEVENVLVRNREKARADLFAELTSVNTTLVFYETAPRLTKTLTAAAEFFRGRELAVAREMTKMFEECVNGGAEELIAHFTQNPPKGEIVLMVAPPAAENKENIDLNGVLKELMKNMPLKSAVNEAVKTCGLNKNEVYRRAVEIKNEG